MIPRHFSILCRLAPIKNKARQITWRADIRLRPPPKKFLSVFMISIERMELFIPCVHLIIDKFLDDDKKRSPQ